MTHFNFIPVNARLEPKSRLPGSAGHSPYTNEVTSTCTALAPAPHLFGGHLWALLALAVVQSPSRPVRPAMAPLLARSSPSSVFRLFFFYSPPPSPSALAFPLVSRPLRKQTKKKDFVGKVLSTHSAERFLDIDYPVLYTTHSLIFCLAQQTTNHVSQHSQQGKRSSTMI